MTAGRTRDYVPYDVFLRNESASETRHEWVDGVVYAMSRGSRSRTRGGRTSLLPAKSIRIHGREIAADAIYG